MKKVLFFLPAMVLMLVTVSASSQKYKRATDSVRLNKELLEVNKDIAELNYKLGVAKGDVVKITERAEDANTDAQNSVNESSRLADKAANGDLGDAKKSKRKARKAYGDAKDAISANKKADKQDKKIANLTKKVEKKQQKADDLNTMLINIRNLPQ